jgi:hypothetical protein
MLHWALSSVECTEYDAHIGDQMPAGGMNVRLYSVGGGFAMDPPRIHGPPETCPKDRRDRSLIRTEAGRGGGEEEDDEEEKEFERGRRKAGDAFSRQAATSYKLFRT